MAGFMAELADESAMVGYTAYNTDQGADLLLAS